MKSRYLLLYILLALAGVLVGGTCVWLVIQDTARTEQFERTALRLSFHVHLLETMRKEPPSSARQLVLHLADSDVLDLMAIESPRQNDSTRRLNARTFRAYAQLRKQLPEASSAPAYISGDDQAEYLEKGTKIQEYLEKNSGPGQP